MPRIDPSRLLKCLTPLLDPNSGAIKSDKEVDKIYGLMSKFSKKLVSKCTYINILKASNTGVLDLFMQRGGWEMIHGWTVDATSNKNHALLNEIASLLIHTPASIQRLKENDLPRLIKTLSKDCENDVTRELAKKVVAKWISIAKQEDTPISPNKTLNNMNTPVPTSHPHSVLVYNPQGVKANFPNDNSGSHIDQSLNIGSSSNMETENHQEFDSTPFDIGNTDLNDISDFNPEDFSKTIDQHLGEFPSDSGNTEMSTFPTSTTNTVPTPANTVKVQPSTATPPTVIQTAPKITIRTVGGQTTVLNPLNTAGNDGTPYCLVTRDGKHFLMKLKLADQPTFIQQQPSQSVKLEDVTKQIKVDETPAQQVQAAENKQPTVIQSPAISQSSPSSKPVAVLTPMPSSTTPVVSPVEKKRRPRKDPSIVSGGQSGTDGIRTYGKKSPVQVSPSGPTNPVPKPGVSPTPTPKSVDQEDSSKKATPPVKKKSSSASSKSAAAAAAAKLAEEEAKLREKIKKEKQMMKQRQKDAKKQQQEVKDQETLKKLNLSSGTAPHPPATGGMKIPKIPKKVSSFSDAIGIPGATDTIVVPDKISRKEKKEKEKTESSSNVENKDVQPETESPKKIDVEEETKKVKDSAVPPKPRKHRVKVYNSKSSRADDLLKDMTENLNAKGKAEAAKEKEKDKVGEPKSISSGGKPLKRPSVEGISKQGGDLKKLKLSDEKLEKDKLEKKNKEEKEKEKEKEKLKMKEKPKAVNMIKESSAFMDMLNATTESQKTSKKKRRLSSSGSFDKEKDPKAKTILSPTKQDVVKPMFNFYRDTLTDADEAEDAIEETSMEIDEKIELEGSAPSKGAFAPQEDEGKLKSALCIHRVKSKPKKSVRWKEEQELKEFHYFEMDETERVNVTKQNNRDFTAMKQHEKAEEKLFLRRKLIGDPMAEKTEWKKLIPVWLSSDTPVPVVVSEEKGIQEARENTILGLFLPPGSILPDSALEPDLIDSASAEKGESKIIPSEDVDKVTKVCDHRNLPWPLPQGAGFQFPANIMNVSKQFDPEPVPVNNFNMAQTLPMQMPNVSFPPVPAPAVDFNNPWNNPFSVPVPTSIPPPSVNEWNVGPENFVPFSTPNLTMPPPAMPFGMNPYGNFDGPPPMAQEGFNTFNPPNQGTGGPGPNFGGNNNTGPGHSREQNYSGRGHSRGGRGGGGRDFDRDRGSKDYRGGRDRDRNHRDRDHRDDWDRGRDRDRDHRDRDRNRDRDRDHHDRDYREHDRDRPRGKGGKRDVLCRFFKRGFCNNGNNCEFLHNGPPQNNSHYFGGNKDRGSSHSHHSNVGGGGSNNSMNSGFTPMQSNDFSPSSRISKGRPASPSLFDGEDPSSIASMISSNTSATSFAHPPPSVPSSADDEATRFSMPPSSPTSELFPPGTEPAVIPVYSID